MRRLDLYIIYYWGHNLLLFMVSLSHLAGEIVENHKSLFEHPLSTLGVKPRTPPEF
jgi:hypothetical protein